MQQVVIYCHGYGSSANSSKHRALRAAGFDAHCFDADIDPTLAYPYLTGKIDSLLADYAEQEVELVFVGTSLGGWTASRLASAYKARAVVINPSFDPANSLEKYGLPRDLCDKYFEIVTDVRYKYFFAEVDEVIDHQQFAQQLIAKGFDVTVVPGADHRFEEHFDLVINYLKMN